MPPRRQETETNREANMTEMAQAMTQMATTLNQRSIAEEQRDLRKQQREEEDAISKRLTGFRKQDPPKFRGGVEPEEAEFWIQDVEKIFAASRTRAEDKVEFATYMLTGDAEYWWKNTRGIMASNNEEVNWEAFRGKFLDQYFPQTARTKLGDDFLKLRQRGMTIGEYAAKFESMSRHFRFFQNNVDETYMCHRFQEGLRDDIQDSVIPLGIKRFQQLVEKCREVEVMKDRRLNQRNKESTGSRNGGPVRNNQNQGRGRHPQDKPYHRPQGNAGGQYRPMVQNTEPRGNQAKREDITCFCCGETGHFANRCTREKKDLCLRCKKLGPQARDGKERKAGANRG